MYPPQQPPPPGYGQPPQPGPYPQPGQPAQPMQPTAPTGPGGQTLVIGTEDIPDRPQIKPGEHLCELIPITDNGPLCALETSQKEGKPPRGMYHICLRSLDPASPGTYHERICLPNSNELPIYQEAARTNNWSEMEARYVRDWLERLKQLLKACGHHGNIPLLAQTGDGQITGNPQLPQLIQGHVVARFRESKQGDLNCVGFSPPTSSSPSTAPVGSPPPPTHGAPPPAAMPGGGFTTPLPPQQAPPNAGAPGGPGNPYGW